MNTRETLGDVETFRGLITGTITSFEDDYNGNINDNIFKENIAITSINLPNAKFESYNSRITSFLVDCSKLTSFNMPNYNYSYTSDFANVKLTSISLLKLTTLYGGDFNYNSNIKSLDIRNATGYYNQSSGLRNLTNLESINVSKLVRPNNYDFNSCYKLETLSLPKCGEILQNSISNCTVLKSVYMPNVTTVGNDSLSGCPMLKRLDFPKLTRVYTRCFNKVETLIIRTNAVCVINSVPSSLVELYVPDNLVDSYKSATNWSAHASKIKPLSELPEE